MARIFPYCTQQVERGCVYLKPDEDFARRKEELERAIVVQADGCHNRDGLGSMTAVINFLIDAYGGRRADYPWWSVARNAYMVQLPPTLTRNRVIERGTAWGQRDGWYFSPWEDNEVLYEHQKPYMIQLKVINFPRDLWQEKFVEQAVAEFGEMCYIEEADLRGTQREAIHVWIQCVDPYRIPFSSAVLYDGRWKECYFQVIQWYHTGWAPPGSSRGNGGDQQERNGEAAPDQDENRVRNSLLQAHDMFVQYLQTPLTTTDSDSSSSAMDEDLMVQGGPKKKDIFHTNLDTPKPAKNNPCETKEPLLQSEKKGEPGDKSRNWTTCAGAEEKVSISVGEFSIIHQVSVNITIGQITITPQLSYTEQLNSLLVLSQLNNTKEKVKGVEQKRMQKGHAEITCQNDQGDFRKDSTQTGDLIYYGQKIKAQSHLRPVKKVHHTLNENINATNKPSLKEIQTSAHPAISPIYTHPNKQLSKHPSNHLSTQKQNKTMQGTDDEFIARFAALSSGQAGTSRVIISHEGISTRDWSLTAMVRVVTERQTIESNFDTNMRRIWGAHSETEIMPLAKNIFLVQFQNNKDLCNVMNRGIWLYRGDAVITRRVEGPADLENRTVEEMEVVVQFHRIPSEVLSYEGIMQLAEQLGSPMSEVTETFLGNMNFYKVKVKMSVENPLPDTLEAEIPELGTI